MLADHPIQPVLLASDLEVAREFYTEKLGLPVLEEDEHRLVVRCGPGSLTLSLSTVGSSEAETKAAWSVEDLEVELSQLHSRGVSIEQYDSDELRTSDGIADVGFARAAWTVDPFGSALSMLEPKK